MPSVAKFLIAGGVCLLGVCLLGVCLFIGGVLLALGSRFLGGVSGDIALKRGNCAFYFSVVSSIVLSLVATVVLNILLRLR